ncbi:MAG TPA: DNA methyltransferase, partial [Polyangiaceae bacterium]
GQSESGMAELVKRFTVEGELVLDPFCGGGTTGVVAQTLGRRFTGIDNDKTALATTRARMEAADEVPRFSDVPSDTAAAVEAPRGASKGGGR